VAAYEAIDDPTRSTTQRPPGQNTRVELTVTTPAAASGLPALLQELGIPFALAYLGMFKILDAQGLFAALRLDDVTLAPSDGEWEVRHQGRPVHVSERALAKLVFGPERWPSFAEGTFPIEFFQWQLDRI